MLLLPGADLPLDTYFTASTSASPYFPSAAAGEWRSNTPTLRERSVYWLVDAVSDKPRWTRKVFDEAVMGRMRGEMAGMVEKSREGLGPRPSVAERDEVAGRGQSTSEAASRSVSTSEPSASPASTKPSTSSTSAPTPSSSPPSAPYTHLQAGFSDAMWTAALAELRTKASTYERTHIVSVLDGAGAVFKSDHAVSPAINAALCAALVPLEEGEVDWHPGSEGVRDLVHPSMYPLVYGRTRVRGLGGARGEHAAGREGREKGENGGTWRAMVEVGTVGESDTSVGNERELTLTTCLDAIGTGSPIPVPVLGTSSRLLSGRFQWLPAEVDILPSPSGHVPQVRFVTYINNLHPSERSAYAAIEGVVGAAVPLLAAAHARVMGWQAAVHAAEADEAARVAKGDYRGMRDDDARLSRTRIPCMSASRACTTTEACAASKVGTCHPLNRPSRTYPRGRARGRPDDADQAWFDATHPVIQPEPEAARCAPSLDTHPHLGEPDPHSGLWFPTATHPHAPRERLQIIVKLASIHLTPSRPTFPGGTWHVEGLGNERIAATALYYYDSENVGGARLAFRTRANAEDMARHFRADSFRQDDRRAWDAVYGVPDDDGEVELGSVATPQGRLVAFPNTFKHRVLPFSLQDASRPGHRKILALFLVDPATRVVSTAHVPPQQAHWRRGGAGGEEEHGGRAQPTPEGQGQDEKKQNGGKEGHTVVDDRVECPYTLATAKLIRAQLIDERKSDDRRGVPLASWNFCEH